MPAPDRTDPANPDAPRVVASLGLGITMYALSRGVPLARIVEETGVDADALLRGDAWLPHAVVPRLWNLLAEIFPGEALGLDMARQAPTELFGELARASRFAPDLGTVLRRFVRHQGLLSDELELTLVDDGQHARLLWRHPSDAVDGGQAAELAMGLALRTIRGAFGPDVPVLRAEFRHAPRAPLAVYTQHLGVPVRFAKSEHAVVLTADALHLPNPRAEPELELYIERQLTRVAVERGARVVSDRMHRIRSAVAHNAARGDFTTEGLARHLAMSTRSLQRALAAETTSAAALLEQARRVHAQRLLSDELLSIATIAEMLGYASERSFRRAFTRWTTVSPARFRRDRQT